MVVFLAQEIRMIEAQPAVDLFNGCSRIQWSWKYVMVG